MPVKPKSHPRICFYFVGIQILWSENGTVDPSPGIVLTAETGRNGQTSAASAGPSCPRSLILATSVSRRGVPSRQLKHLRHKKWSGVGILFQVDKFFIVWFRSISTWLGATEARQSNCRLSHTHTLSQTPPTHA